MHKLIRENDEYSVLDMCSCSNCNINLKVSECIEDYGNHNGWEMPPYSEYFCPKCEEIIEDFWPSEMLLDEWSRIKNAQVNS